MALEETVSADLKRAMLDKDEIARDTLRMLKAGLMNRAVELGRSLETAEEIAVLKSAVKSRQESVEQYTSGGRADLADKERKEISILERYLPKQMSDAELRKVVEGLVRELSLSSKKDMGRLMKELKARHDGQYDGRAASVLVGEFLK